MSDAQTNLSTIYLVLGCFGQVDNGFISCAGCENRILSIIPAMESYDGLMSYLDTCRLFDKPCFDFNAIKNILNYIHVQIDQPIAGRRIWTEKEIALYEKFIVNHRICGLYLKLELDKSNLPPKQQVVSKTVSITATSKLPKIPTPKLDISKLRRK